MTTVLNCLTLLLGSPAVPGDGGPRLHDLDRLTSASARRLEGRVLAFRCRVTGDPEPVGDGRWAWECRDQGDGVLRTVYPPRGWRPPASGSVPVVGTVAGVVFPASEVGGHCFPGHAEVRVYLHPAPDGEGVWSGLPGTAAV